jgi:hypothetical protein
MVWVDTQESSLGKFGLISGSFYLLLTQPVRLSQSCLEFLLNHQGNLECHWIEHLD